MVYIIDHGVGHEQSANACWMAYILTRHHVRITRGTRLPRGTSALPCGSIASGRLSTGLFPTHQPAMVTRNNQLNLPALLPALPALPVLPTMQPVPGHPHLPVSDPMSLLG